jgi:hypothetical protein
MKGGGEGQAVEWDAEVGDHQNAYHWDQIESLELLPWLFILFATLNL